jgi:hypothetical protein
VQSLSVGQTVEGALGPNLIQYFAFNVTSSLATIGMLEVEPWARGYYWYRGYTDLSRTPCSAPLTPWWWWWSAMQAVRGHRDGARPGEL